ncbi:ribonuclease H-like domain-containing protein [Armillaria luteobubalina]|uniref:ribonuclease H n=1 Tax=Armillaria luteobubalina TaxID=153913 RepID=A0AA39UVK8_9AGAR|nr:ribonuclease H-like domain-containing protein [Armillaria luteobubalina]
MVYPSIINREFIPYKSDSLYQWATRDQLVTCTHCARYFAACFACPCSVNDPRLYNPCHNFKLVFTDGACSNNGQPYATSGIGISMGTVSEYRWSIPIDESIDRGKSRTSQRAELLAAIYGLKKINEADIYEAESIRKHGSPAYNSHLKVGVLGHAYYVPHYVVVTDSRYVAEGMTKWLPEWKKNSWKNSRGEEPTNIDLFAELDNLVMRYEMMGYQVGFWKIGREDNHEADSLAKQAA